MRLQDAQAKLTMFHMGFGANLSELLQRSGNDRQWLEAQTGLDQPTISKLISGKQNPTLPQMLIIETAFGLQRGHFLRQAGFVEDGDLTVPLREVGDISTTGHW